MTSTPPGDISTVFDDLVEKYGATYGAGWAERVPPMTRRVQLACEQKDLAVLLDLLLPDNPFLREVFARLTSIALPRTQRAIRTALEGFVGPQKVAAYRQLLEQQRRLRQREELQYKVAEHSVRTDAYGVLRMDEFIQRLIADGYMTPREFPRGNARMYGLYNDRHAGYHFKRKVEYLYMRILLEERQAADAAQATAEQPAEPVEPRGVCACTCCFTSTRTPVRE